MAARTLSRDDIDSISATPRAVQAPRDSRAVSPSARIVGQAAQEASRIPALQMRKAVHQARGVVLAQGRVELDHDGVGRCRLVMPAIRHRQRCRFVIPPLPPDRAAVQLHQWKPVLASRGRRNGFHSGSDGRRGLGIGVHTGTSRDDRWKACDPFEVRPDLCGSSPTFVLYTTAAA